MNEVRAKDIMKSPIVSVEFTNNTLQVSSLMKEKNVGSVFVEKNGNFVGMITKRDLIWRVLAEQKNPEKISATEVMTSPVVTADLETTLSQIARIMAKNKIRRVLITNGGNPVGVVSEHDIVKVAPTQIELLSEYVRILQ